MKTAKTVTIDGEEYLLGHWAVDKANEILAWLIESFGPAFRSAYSLTETSSVEQTKDDIALALSFLEVVAKNLSTVCTPKEYAQRIREFLSDVVSPQKGTIVYNVHFQGRILHLHKVVLEVLKYQYSDFLVAAQDQLGMGFSQK